MLPIVMAQHIINEMKDISARDGIPDYLVSDNKSQNSIHQITDFVTTYDFKHITSSLR